jgi:iron complex transport system substrate-binding protein
MKKYHLIILIALLGCKEKKHAQIHRQENKSETLIKYAEGFRVKYFDDYKEVEVTYPFQGATSGYKYLLIPRDKKIPEHDPSVRVIRIPVQSIVCTSTTHIPLLDYLGLSDKLVGFPTTDYISSEKMRIRIDEGKVQDLGIDKGLNIEQLVILNPDLIMGYTVSSDYGQFKKIEELGLHVVINAEYLEKHPLGRAEWIKFTALFFNKEKEADSVFNEIEKNYLETKTLAGTAKNKPSVLSGIVYGDTWFLPGGQNNVAKLLKDAKCKYLWEDNNSHGFLQLSFESVYATAKEADLWIGVGDFRTLDDIKNADQRYAAFKPFVNHNVYNYDARKGAKGGSEFMELGYLRPDIVMKDLVKIAHPELLPGYKLYFHRRLD